MHRHFLLRQRISLWGVKVGTAIEHAVLAGLRVADIQGVPDAGEAVPALDGTLYLCEGRNVNGIDYRQQIV